MELIPSLVLFFIALFLKAEAETELRMQNSRPSDRQPPKSPAKR